MKNIMMIIAYDGSKFHGFQRQPDQRTVQGEIEKAVFNLTGQNINIIPCGRTDTGVHASMHVLNFLIETNIPGNAFKFKLEKILNDDIVIIESKEVMLDFHSRYDCKEKTYRYILRNAKYPLPFESKYKAYFRKKLNINKMQEASKKLLGEHDFTAFMKWGEDKNPIRRIENINIYKEKDDIIFEFTAQSFLHNQIRITVGLLVDIGRGYRDISFIDDIFEKKVQRAGKTFSPEGLYLVDIKY